MKRVKLTHGSARVEDNVSEETLKALDELSKKAYRILDPELCPNRDNHTNDPTMPHGYVQRFEWARKKAKTHRQTKCTGCNLYVIWVEKHECDEPGCDRKAPLNNNFCSKHR